MLNTGEMPDCGFMYSNPLDLYKKGLTRTIPRQFITEYAPNYVRELGVNPLGWKMNINPDARDEYLALIGVAANQRSHIMHSMYRADWL